MSYEGFCSRKQDDHMLAHVVVVVWNIYVGKERERERKRERERERIEMHKEVLLVEG